MNQIKLDRTLFSMTKSKNQKLESSSYSQLNVYERLNITAYLNASAFNFPINEPPKIDKSIFKMSKH